MGIFGCNICFKKEENDDDDDKKNRKKWKNKFIRNSKIIINNSSETIIEEYFLNNTIYEKDPLEDYEIIKNLNSTKNQVIKKVNKGMKLFEKLYIMECIEEINKDINYILNDIFKLNTKGIVKINSLYQFGNKLYAIYDNIEHNLLKEERIDVEIKYRKQIIEQLFNIVNYLHEHNIYNIGIDFDTLFLQKKATKKILKKKLNTSKELNINKNIMAYSLSVSLVNILQANYNISSIQFYSPEIIKQINKYKINTKEIYSVNKNDEWSCGIFLYYLITGEFPYKEDDINNNNNLDLSFNQFNNSNESEKDLLLKLLEKDANKRISIKECLEHPFIKDNLEEDKISIEEKKENNDSKKEEPVNERINEQKIEVEISNEEKEIEEKEINRNAKQIKEEEKDSQENSISDLNEKDINLLKKLLDAKKPINKLHELAIAYLSYHFINEDEKIIIKNLFDYLDTNKDGKITEEDIINAFNKNKIQFTLYKIKQILDVFDYDLTNGIDFQNFLRHLCSKEELLRKENLKKLFDAIDINKNNFINEQDIYNFITDESITNIVFEKNFLETLGIKDNDKICFEQFTDLFKNK